MNSILRYPKWLRIVTYFFAAMMIAGSVFSLIYFTFFEASSAVVVTLIAVIAIGMSALGILGARDAYRSQLTITEQALTYRGVFKTTVIRMEHLRGYRMNEKYLVFESKNKKDKISVSTYLQQFSAVQDWAVGNLVELDEAEAIEEEQKLIASKGDERRMAEARIAIRIYSYLGYAVAAWAFFFPDPYELAVWSCAAWPILAIALAFWYGNLIVINKRTNSHRPSPIYSLLVTTIILPLRILFDFHILDYTLIWEYVIVGGVVLSVALLFLTKEFTSELKTYPLMLGIALIYGWYLYGVYSFVNCHYDTSKPEINQTTVVEKNVIKGKTTSYDLTLASWKPNMEPETISVKLHEFNQVSVGDTVVVHAYPGLLNTPWLDYVGPKL